MKTNILIALLLSLIFISCDNMVVVHTNKYDPLSPDYVPAPPIAKKKVASEDYIEIRWTDKSEGAQGFIISRGYDKQIIDTIFAFSDRTYSEYAYRDSLHVELDKYYYYYVSAFTRNHKSSPLSFTFFTTLISPSIKNFATVSSDSVNIYWESKGSILQASSYNLERKNNSIETSDFTLRATIDSSLTSYLDTDLDTSNTYSYRMRSFTKKYKSAYSIVKKIKFMNGTWRIYY